MTEVERPSPPQSVVKNFVRTIDRVECYELRRDEFERLQSALAAGSRALTFAGVLTGVFVSCVTTTLSIIRSDGWQSVVSVDGVVLLVVDAVSLVLGGWFWFVYRGEKSTLDSLIEEIKASSTIQSDAPGARGAP